MAIEFGIVNEVDYSSGMLHPIPRTLVSIGVAALMLTACRNHNYADLMRVTAETDVAIASYEKMYAEGNPAGQRIGAREQIVRLRQKQMIMAQRIHVSTMPEVSSGKMTKAEGEAIKSKLVEAATKRYEEAKALPVPSN